MNDPLWQMARAFFASRWEALRRARASDEGISTTEVALITAGLLAAAGLLIAAINGKLHDLMGAISSS